MKKKVIFTILIFILLFNIGIIKAHAILLPVKAELQRDYDWCWAASAATIINTFGGSVAQCDLANYAAYFTYPVWDYNCCNYNFWDYYNYQYEENCDIANYFWNYYDYWAPLFDGKSWRSVQTIMRIYGVDTTFYHSPLSQSTGYKELMAGRLFMMDHDYHGQYAHATVGMGLVGNVLWYFDPDQYNGGFYRGDYNAVVSNVAYNWIETLKSNFTPPPPVPDLRINGAHVSRNVTPDTLVNISYSVTPGFYSGGQGEIWLGAWEDSTKQWLYLDPSGNLQFSPYMPTTPSFQGTIGNISTKSIYYGTIPSGFKLTLICAVDLTPDKTANDYYVDTLGLTSLPGMPLETNYSLSGVVMTGGGGGGGGGGGSSPLAGVTMILTGAGTGTTTTDSSGNYSFSGLSNGSSYTVTPSMLWYTFTPTSRDVTISEADVTGQDFTVTYTTTYSISGTVTSGGSPLSGVTMTLSPPPGIIIPPAITDSNGNYSFSGLPNGAYTVRASETGYTFTPTSRSVAISGANVTGQDFTGTPTGTTYSISGTVTRVGSPFSGVTMTLSGDAARATTTDSSGNYSFTNLANGSYTVKPSRTGCSFTPSSRNVTISGADVTGQNFTSSKCK